MTLCLDYLTSAQLDTLTSAQFDALPSILMALLLVNSAVAGQTYQPRAVAAQVTQDVDAFEVVENGAVATGIV